MDKTSIIIPIYKNIDWTKLCINSIATSTDNYELILINNSNDKIVSTLINNIAIPLKSFNFDKNMGSYYAWNYAVENLVSSDTKFLCFMHNDTIVTQNWLKNLIIHLQEEDDIAVTSPCSNYVDENEYLVSRELMDLYIQYKKNNKDFVSIEDIEQSICSTYEIDTVYDINVFVNRLLSIHKNANFRLTNNISTFCCLMSKGTFEQYGPFDEDFYPHLYSEKIMKKKMSLDGLKTSCCYKSFVHHNGNTTTDCIDFSYHEMADKNKILYKEKMRNLFAEENVS